MKGVLNRFLLTAFFLAVVLTPTTSLAQSNSDEPIVPDEIKAYLDSYDASDPNAKHTIRQFIQPGAEQETTQYYLRISNFLGFDFLNSNLDSLLSYLGYSVPIEQKGTSIVTGFLAKDLEELPSFALMPRNDTEFIDLLSSVTDPDGFKSLLSLTDFQSDSVLVSRFFAPKIATYFYADPAKVDTPIVAGDITPGWRKLVRLKPRPGSDAERVGKISHVYILFNFKRQDATADPFADNESGNNQVIVVPRDQSTGDRVFFAVYQKKSLGYPIGFFLQADFDLPGHVGLRVSGAVDGQYYVPRSCAECHGHSTNGLLGQPVDAETLKPVEDFGLGIYRFAKPNYLDTDQWYDWMEIDFPQVVASTNDVVFDGGKDYSSGDYARAFQIIRAINEDIAKESLAAESNASQPSFQSLGVYKWLELHKSSNTRMPYSVRSIGLTPWSSGNDEEMQLLGLLNNHCFRCHSSLRYSVFDRDAVKNRKKIINFYLNNRILDAAGNPLPGYAMPQGRVLAETDRLEIIRLMDKVFP